MRFSSFFPGHFHHHQCLDNFVSVASGLRPVSLRDFSPKDSTDACIRVTIGIDLIAHMYV